MTKHLTIHTAGTGRISRTSALSKKPKDGLDARKQDITRDNQTRSNVQGAGEAVAVKIS